MKSKKIQLFKCGISIVIMTLSIIILVNSILISNEPIYQYQINQDTDYKVYLEKNDFINEPYLTKNQLYIQNIVKYIEINFLYQYKASHEENLHYQYDISSTLNINYTNTNQTLVTKDYPIITNKTLEQKDSEEIEVKESINIDYQMYYQEVQKFKQQFNLPVSASLVVSFNLQMQIGEEQDKKVSVAMVTIDLTGSVFEIKVQESEDEQDTILEIGQMSKATNNFSVGILSILFVSSFFYLMYQIRKYHISKTTKSKKETKEILRKYGQIIIELEKEPEINMNNVIDVKNFNELIEVEEEIREPVLYYEKDGKAVFLIIDHHVTYRKIIE